MTNQFGDVMPMSVLRRIACEADITLITLDPDGNPLSLGRTSRLASAAQRQALAIRDKHCTHPGCDRPPSWCVAHHSTPWSTGGGTDITNMRLLCPAHHAHEHRRRTPTTRPTNAPQAQPP